MCPWVLSARSHPASPRSQRSAAATLVASGKLRVVGVGPVEPRSEPAWPGLTLHGTALPPSRRRNVRWVGHTHVTPGAAVGTTTGRGPASASAESGGCDSQ